VERALCVRAACILVHVCACVVSACGARGQPALAAHPGEFVRVRRVGGAMWAGGSHILGAHRSTSGARVRRGAPF
jgi:hypothetical protein